MNIWIHSGVEASFLKSSSGLFQAINFNDLKEKERQTNVPWIFGSVSKLCRYVIVLVYVCV